MPLCVALLLLAVCPLLRAQEKKAALDFAANVAPIFDKYCTGCHSDDEPDGGLDLTSYKALLEGGDQGNALVPGNSSESRLIRLVTRQEEPFMPPGKRKAPTAEEVEILQRWIDDGAKPPTRPRVPRTLQTPRVELTAPPRQPITAVAFSPQGESLALGRYASFEFYSISQRQVVRRVAGLRGQIMDLAYTHGGSHIVTGGGDPGLAGTADLWNVASGERVRSFEGHTESILAVALSSDSTVLATGSYDGDIRVWDTATGKQLHQLDGHNGAVFDLAFRPNSSLLGSASGDRTVKLWDTKSGERLTTFTEPTKEVYALAFSANGKRLAAAGIESRIRIWSIGEKIRDGTSPLLYSRYGHEGAIIRLAYSADGTLLLSAAEDRTVKIWEATSLNERFLLKKQPDWPAAVDFAPQSDRIAVGCMEGTLEFFDVRTGFPQRLAGQPPRGGFLGHAPLVAFSALTLLGSLAEEKTPKPELMRVEPAGVAAGGTVRLKLTGKYLGSLRNVRFDTEGLVAKVDQEKSSSEEAWVEVTVPAIAQGSTVELFAVTSGGESGRKKLYIGDLPHRYETETNPGSSPVETVSEATSFWGVLAKRGDQDVYAFEATAGETFVIDGEGKRVDSQANLVLTVLDPRGHVVASNNDFGNDPDPLVVYEIPTTGVYHVRVGDLTLAGSADHHYRVSIGKFPFVTSCYPLSVPAQIASEVELVGYNLPPNARTAVPASAPGSQNVVINRQLFRQRGPVKVVVADVAQVAEAEPNDTPQAATTLPIPSIGHGRISARQDDADLFRIRAARNQVLVIETEATRHNSPIDTRIEVLDDAGRSVDRVLLQAVRDSVVTFRPINSNSKGVRLEYWEEMELNQFLYINGEVSRLVRRPRGPDSTWDLYTRRGRRRTYFGTTATSHPLFQPCYIVETHAPGTRLVPNGLPTFTIPYANDDDSLRELGSDSRLLFTPPQSRDYLIRVTNVKAEHGPRYAYRLHVRHAKPDFTVALDSHSLEAPRGTGSKFAVRAKRIDGFEGDIRVEFSSVPTGFVISSPLVIQAGHLEALGTLYAMPDAEPPNDETLKQLQCVATAQIDDKVVTRAVDSFEKVKIGAEPAFFVSLETFATPAERRADAAWEILTPTGYLSAGGATLTSQEDDSLLASGVHPENDVYTITLNTRLDFIEALRIEVLPDDSLPGKRHGRGSDGRFVLTQVELMAAPLGQPGEAQVIQLNNPKASDSAAEASVEHTLDSKSDTGWSVDGNEAATATFELAEVVRSPIGTTLTIKLYQRAEKSGLGRFRIFVKGVPATVRPTKPIELTIAPGETISALIRIERNGHDDEVRFVVDNLPHGVIVDNVGLNGVMVRQGENEREIFLTCDSWVPEGSRLCYAAALNPEGVATSLPVLLHVKKRTGVATK